MDRICPRFARHTDDFGDRQIGRDRPQPLADAIGLVGFEPVQAKLVLLGIDGDGALAQFIGRAHHADGDFAAICDQDLAKFGHGGDLSARIVSQFLAA
jgi:hypothetical protein